jgi:hypothetical protein
LINASCRGYSDAFHSSDDLAAVLKRVRDQSGATVSYLDLRNIIKRKTDVV